jgi:ribosomal protein L11 methyltransferase
MTTFRQLTLLCPGEAVDLIEELMFFADAQAVTLVDSGDTPIFEPPVGSHPVWPQTQLQGLFSDDREDGEILKELRQLFRSAELVIELPKILHEVADQDWVRVTLEQFKPLKIGTFWVRPSWDQIKTPDNLTTLTLDPGLAFGTGMHPTTQMCLEWLSDHPTAGKKVLDFGCGSGILAIASGCLGATSITGLDIDPQALIATANNAALNNLSITTLSADQTPVQPFDVVLANILANPLIDLAPTLTRLVAPSGSLILTGLLNEQAKQVRSAYPEFSFESDLNRDGWTRLFGTKKVY